ncbi:RagB/SusD family nutrient uptake outer membrane protein [Longimonas halophila]|uniref:RagB/SusD family nutrient uptake outer membrane protein n=1 Tax=Longimonas halophila TaxID=1469170 RepID=UPI00159703CB|nr:RagB/SusD family nutrient uptake outer membrane protein [Longimonas halophila]
MVLSSCDDGLLDIQNPNQQTSESFWSTGDQALQGVNAAYEPLTYDGMYNRMVHAAQDIRSDEAVADSPFPPYSNADEFATPATDLMATLIWDQTYQGVYYSNQVITNVPDIDMDEELKSRILGEARFLRSHYYFKLVKLFRNVPLITEEVTDPSNVARPQAAPDSVWAQIIRDLEFAQDNLPETYDADVGRATWGSATAYLGKAHLFNENWEQADAEFEKIINSGLYNLVDNPRWNGDLQHENNAESIWEIQFTTEVGGNDVGFGGVPAPNWGEVQWRSITFSPVGYGFADVEPTQSLYDDFQNEETVNGEDDPRLGATMFYNQPGETIYGDNFQEVYADQINAGQNPIFWRKYQSDTGSGEPDTGSGLNIRAMRYADVLLMYAETRNEIGDQVTAAQYIQQVRDRANLPDRESEFAALSQEEMRDRIAQERKLELAGEGKRFDDIRRWGWLDDPDKMQQLIENDPGFEGYIDGREYLPIPQGELDTNPAAEQNPGY